MLPSPTRVLWIQTCPFSESIINLKIVQDFLFVYLILCAFTWKLQETVHKMIMQLDILFTTFTDIWTVPVLKQWTTSITLGLDYNVVEQVS
jgi:hypothetical protein